MRRRVLAVALCAVILSACGGSSSVAPPADQAMPTDAPQTGATSSASESGASASSFTIRAVLDSWAGDQIVGSVTNDRPTSGPLVPCPTPVPGVLGCPPGLPPKTLVMEGPDGMAYALGPVLLDGSDVTGAMAQSAAFGWEVRVTFGARGAATFLRVTQRAALEPPPQNFLALMADGRIMSVPRVNEPIPGGVVNITGVDQQQAEVLVAELTSRLSPSPTT